MIRREQQIVNNRPAHGLFPGAGKIKTRGGTTPLLKLSAKMVDLSLHNNQQDSLSIHVPAHAPAKSECDSQEPNIQLPQPSLATIIQKEAARSEIEHSGLVQAGLKLLPGNYRIRIHVLPKWLSSLVILALSLIAFSAAYRFLGYHQDSLNSHSQVPTAAEPREKPIAPTMSIASQKTQSPAHIPVRIKSKSRRRRDDYIAKDTTVYYENDGKARH
jgi:hypothetical protein